MEGGWPASEFCTGNNLSGVAVQIATQDQKNATPVQKCIAVFFIPISSKLELFCYAKF